MKQQTKCYTISMPVRTFWLVFLPLCFLLFAVGSLVGFFIVDRKVMPKIVGVHRDVIPTPDVRGMEYEAARNKFYGVGLLTEVRAREFDDSVPDGNVLSQFPEPGEAAKKGRKIAVTVSRGPEVAKIPTLRGINERQARLDLRKSGFTVGNVRKAFSNLPVDAVIETFPPEGTVTSRAMDLDLVVSRGPKPTHAVMPNVIGDILSEAKKKVVDAGLKVGAVTYQNNATLLPGTVMSQSASPGANVPLESSVDLVISAIK
ncbi:MAG: PASTA domain-containing protein [Chitinispirillales bacterium]|nr:PASTA domain-containing protein [Chitinispirillales bacterium]